MPVFVSIKPSYLEALQALGYSESEARFLYLVDTHSGYFVARQFLFFTCGHWAYPRSDALNPASGRGRKKNHAGASDYWRENLRASQVASRNPPSDPASS